MNTTHTKHQLDALDPADWFLESTHGDTCPTCVDAVERAIIFTRATGSTSATYNVNTHIGKARRVVK